MHTQPEVICAMFSTTELILLLFIAFLLFGGKRVPQIGRAIGNGIRTFINAIKNDKDEGPKSPETDNAASSAEKVSPAQSEPVTPQKPKARSKSVAKPKTKTKAKTEPKAKSKKTSAKKTKKS